MSTPGAGGGGRKEVELRLKVVADTAAGVQAMNNLAAAAARVEAAGTKASRALGGGSVSEGEAMKKRLEAIRNLGLGGVVGNIGQVQGYGQAFQELGIPGGRFLERNAGKFGVAQSVIQGATQTAATLGRTLNDRNLTSTQMGRQLFRDLVPFGESIQGAFDDITGRTADFEQAELQHRNRMADVQGRNDLASFNLGYRPQQAALDMQAAQLAKAKPILMGRVDRSTAEGEKEYRDKQRMLPIERESAKAERDAATAAAARTAASKELRDLERKQNELLSERERLQKRLDGEGSGARRQEILYQMSENASESQANANLRRSAAQAEVEAKNREAQARAQVGMVGVKKLQAEADELGEDANKSASLAVKLGRMNVFQQQEAARNLELFKQFGPQALDPSQVASAEMLAPDTVRKGLEKAGAASAVFAQVTGSTPGDFKAGSPEELRRRQGAKLDEKAKQELANEAQLAKATADAGKDLGKSVADAIKQVVEATKNEIMAQLFLGKNAK